MNFLTGLLWCPRKLLYYKKTLKICGRVIFFYKHFKFQFILATIGTTTTIRTFSIYHLCRWNLFGPIKILEKLIHGSWHILLRNEKDYRAPFYHVPI